MIETMHRSLGNNLLRKRNEIENNPNQVENNPSNAFDSKSLQKLEFKILYHYEMQEVACSFFSTENSWRGFDISSYKEEITTWGGFWPLERKNAVLKSPDQK